MSSNNSGVESSAAPMPECVLIVGEWKADLETSPTNENGFGQPQLRSLCECEPTSTHESYGSVILTCLKHPVRQLWRLEQRAPGPKCRFERSLWSVKAGEEGLTIWFLHGVSREYWTLSLCVGNDAGDSFAISIFNSMTRTIYNPAGPYDRLIDDFR